MRSKHPSSELRLLPVFGCVLVVLGSCGDSQQVLDDSPGVYDGSTDPLTERSAEERASVLSERLKLVQGRE